MARVASATLVSLALSASLASGPLAAAPQRGQQPTFRTFTSLVPVDVRVVDKDGKPITDLVREDFTVLENTVVQKIVHFSRQDLVAMVPAPGEKPAFRKPGAVVDVAPQNQRIFLIVLARGRLQSPSNGLDGLMHFVRKRLLPQDQVAVLAWNRATDFTTDHEKIAQLLERFKKGHEKIESTLQQQLGGLAAVYGSKAIPANLQSQIDAVFGGPSGVASRQLPPGDNPNAAAMGQEMRRTTDALQSAEIEKQRLASEQRASGLDRPGATASRGGAGPSSPDLGRTDLPFEEYVSTSVQTLHDLDSIYAGISYLRYLEGEKHLVLTTEQGLFVGTMEGVNAVTGMANDARVVIDTIQTGGIAGGGTAFGSMPGSSWSGRQALRDLRTMAQATGGQASLTEYTEKAVDRIDETTRVSYLLGYYPTNTRLDGRYRRIVVRVNRPGATVLFRHGYYAQDQLVPYDRQAFMTHSRIASAGAYVAEIRDIPLTAKVSVGTRPGGTEPDAVVELAIDISKLPLAQEGDRHVGLLNVAVFCGGKQENLIGQIWQTVDLKLSDATLERLRKEGVPATLHVPLRPGELKFVKVIVYSYTSDLLGTTLVKMK